MRLEDFIKRVVQERIDAGYVSNVTADEAVDMYLREGVIANEADWKYEEDTKIIYIDGIGRIFDVPPDYSLGELYHNISILYRFNKSFLKFE